VFVCCVCVNHLVKQCVCVLFARKTASTAAKYRLVQKQHISLLETLLFKRFSTQVCFICVRVRCDSFFKFHISSTIKYSQTNPLMMNKTNVS
jgi:hypothetical protein